VKSNTEAYAELSKAIHAFGSVDHTSMIQRDTWIASSGIYVVAAGLETLVNKSKLPGSGINTLSTNTHTSSRRSGAQTDYPPVFGYIPLLTTYDGILLIQNGVCSV
jgi:hypothetical protein